MRVIVLANVSISKGKDMPGRPLLYALGVACAAACGCASQGPQPTEELTRARTLVDQADKAQAQRYAAADLQRAHDELSQAEAANGQGHFDTARAAAQSAAVDADLAAARASAAEAQRAANELRQSNATLERQTEQAVDAPGSPVVPPPPGPAADSMDQYPSAPPPSGPTSPPPPSESDSSPR